MRAARFRPRWKTASYERILVGAVLLFLSAFAVFAAGEVARRLAAESLVADAETRLPTAVATLRGELEKQRALPLILREDPAIASAVASGDPARLVPVNEKLERLARATRAAVIYILDASGKAVAASNWRDPTSFVGSDYRFRAYYARALAEGTAEQYALGTVSGRPGVYFSARIDGNGGIPLGVVVAKVELDAVEEDWRRGGLPVFVTDERGIVLPTSVPQWRFNALRPLREGEADAIRRSLQFGGAPLAPLRLVPDPALAGIASVDPGTGADRRFAVAEAPVTGGLPGWRLHLLMPVDRDLGAASGAARLVAALFAVCLALAGFVLVRRRRLLRMRREIAERSAAELEIRVAERTTDLARANRRLTDEIAEREKAEGRVASLRDDLAQANRLATLGQVTAGVAHEINQPLAAIRTFAENARLFIARQDGDTADRNIEKVVDLTGRIAAITETLRGFSRRGRGALEPLGVEEILDGALLILRSRVAESGVVVERLSSGVPAVILGGRIRLEQVLVNLLRNSIEALEGRGDGRIRIAVARRGEEITIEVADNGPGIPAEILPVLFTPFRTSKAKGTGLGLVISADIVTELGGVLAAANRPGAGATFTIRLPAVGEKHA